MARPLRGGGVKGRPLRKKYFFFKFVANFLFHKGIRKKRRTFFCDFPKVLGKNVWSINLYALTQTVLNGAYA